MNKKQPKRRRDIKSKLLAAVCMLLASTIMMISSTYAWFTLSTAPEVKGIQTAVGANGNLEMALLPKDGLLSSITSAVGDSTKAIEAKNVTWGNLVDVSDDTVYGLDKITLFPSALNAATTDENGNPTSLAAAMLAIPTYGADGRPSELLANTVTGYYNKGASNFAPNASYGVRAVGTASGMTPRQLDYRNARSAANTAKAQAANQASQSLNNRGSALANIAIKYGMDKDNATFGETDVQSLRRIINDLKGTVGVLDRIETAYMQYILAYAASAATGETDTAWKVVKDLVEADGATLDSVMAGLPTNVTLPGGVTTGIDNYKAAVAAVNEADTALQVLEKKLGTDENATFDWNEISTAMRPLANPEKIEINDIPANEVKTRVDELVSAVLAQGGLRVIMKTGAGVYANIADQCGDYTASVTIEKVEYTGIVLENTTARMETKTTVTPAVYLEQVGTAVKNVDAPTGTGNAVLPITDMYGFIVDLAFRTNAADSKLLLQVKAADRIYNNNTNEETLGGGSSMTFQATTPDFTDKQVKELMSAIRIVFFVPDTITQDNHKIVATAKLDTSNPVLGADGLTAKMYLYKMEGKVETKIDDNAIMPLIQNQATALSVLVYLDGNNVGNKDVAATASTSMTGKMNLQFASSATLVPMDYAALHIPANNNP